MSHWILDYIDTYPDFPQKGVEFKWIGRLLRDAEAFHKVIAHLAKRYRGSRLDAILSLEARGFIFAAPLAYELHLPLVLIRKPGRLPGEVLSTSYDMEYASNTIEIEEAGVERGQELLIVDDVLATGGTTRAACDLVHKMGAEVEEVAVILEIEKLHGRELLPCPVHSLVKI